MKSYPSIEYADTCRVPCHVPIVAFDKLDGSNVRFEWTSKRGFYKCGSRHRLIDSSDPTLGRVPGILDAGMGQRCDEALRAALYDRAVCFFEYHGDLSQFGQHDPSDTTMRLTLIDVAPYKQGILEPEEFLRLFGHLDVPKVLYRGTVTPEFIESVQSSTLEGMTFEGVVCKGKNDKKTKMPIMFKHKSAAWFQKLKEKCAGDNEMYVRLM